MKKSILLFTIAAIMMSGTACTAKTNSSESQTQSSAEDTASTTAPEQESKPDTESLTQESTSEVTSAADPTSETQPDTESTAETDLDVFLGELDGYDCAVALVGYTDTEDVNSVRECAENSLTAGKHSFVSEIPDDRIILAGGGEVYCIVPADKDAKVTVNSLDYGEDGEEIAGDELYSGDAPILLCCNVSDIMSNAVVSITSGENTVKFSPFVSLRDGQLGLPEDLKILDFSEYEF